MIGRSDRRRTLKKDRPSFIECLATFQVDVDLDDEVFARNPAPSRTVFVPPDQTEQDGA
jgi:hypothetical protein